LKISMFGIDTVYGKPLESTRLSAQFDHL